MPRRVRTGGHVGRANILRSVPLKGIREEGELAPVGGNKGECESDAGRASSVGEVRGCFLDANIAQTSGKLGERTGEF